MRKYDCVQIIKLELLTNYYNPIYAYCQGLLKEQTLQTFDVPIIYFKQKKNIYLIDYVMTIYFLRFDMIIYIVYRIFIISAIGK